MLDGWDVLMAEAVGVVKEEPAEELFTVELFALLRDFVGRDIRVMSCVKQVCQFVRMKRDGASRAGKVGSPLVGNVIKKKNGGALGRRRLRGRT